ncbi:RNA-binding S4 domain-containing protein [Alkalibacter mobilis]|uniref:RNA-binding S4 domain-containing protein n=1 Tax=Alkalibacter mobilis TaxID=2787712 RepID=UPI00189ED85D|nr:RNA-binding S4 domain-containing protein [Alkalibacter mobilis]MBF7096087.1 RNA-binding S4 domain-containing protein [Alkalibacter mobilis]
MKEIPVSINTDYIKLDQFLKYTGLADSGSFAKMLIKDGEVLVDGEVCLQRGKKLYPGCKVTVKDTEEIFVVKKEEE